ncbi:ribosomal protein S8 [Peptoniphilus duerdenii ATCC BAA-1640]|uniref:Small ribosomal subunit protein uS8 n=2 Tax=Peptoniphilus TaxID=162289 RepID=E0NJ23_9FIRM|nr:ribosomal protein S8 [Peptoniphilus duerdenii ATCC BAA-1640]
MVSLAKEENYMMTDPIADMLTRIRNSNNAKHKTVDVPASNIKKEIAQILLDEGYIKSFDFIEDNKQGMLKVELKYTQDGDRVISGLKRISKPGLRVYANSQELPKVLGGLGIAIISTSKGIITDKTARELNVGGEVICYVW